MEPGFGYYYNVCIMKHQQMLKLSDFIHKASGVNVNQAQAFFLQLLLLSFTVSLRAAPARHFYPVSFGLAPIKSITIDLNLVVYKPHMRIISSLCTGTRPEILPFNQCVLRIVIGDRNLSAFEFFAVAKHLNFFVVIKEF